MNQQIQQLHTEAWDYACSKIPPNALGQKNHEDYFSEKFAELIVRECAEYITEYFPHSRYEAMQMKKHFGVDK